LANELTKAGVRLRHIDEGPDFFIENGKNKIWIEVITPKPEGVPPEWVNQPESGTWGFPHEAILLRWTGAIKDKAEKLLGNPDRNIRGYIPKGIVAENDAYVIAINGRLLRGKAFPQLEGISQFPFAVESTFCVGPFAFNIDRRTLHTTGSGHQHRPLIPKLNGAQIPTDTFLDPRFAAISAIWAVDIDENLLLDRSRPMIVVHNPSANNPIVEGFLPAYAEYIAIDQGNEYLLECRSGRLA
jgi:hypothetical protein